MTLYKIANWNKYYENHRTREMKRMDWVAVPTKMDGDGYTELVMHPDGAAHFGAWLCLLLIASRCEPRGTLIRSGEKPHDPASLSRISRVDTAIFRDAIARLVDIGWLTREEFKTNDLEESGEIPRQSGDFPRDPAPRASAIHGTERNGTEEKDTERNAGASELPVPFSLIKPEPPPGPDLWKIFWQLFVIAGKALGDRDQEKALSLWLNFEPPEHQRILSWAMNQAKSVWSSERYTPMPANALESKGWNRVAAERLIPDLRAKTATDEAFDIVKRGWKA